VGRVRIIIRFKSGYELSITCDEFVIKTNRITGEIDSYDIKGIKDNKPIFFRSEDVECVYAEIKSARNLENYQKDMIVPSGRQRGRKNEQMLWVLLLSSRLYVESMRFL
jgi:hypothetical protein